MQLFQTWYLWALCFSLVDFLVGLLLCPVGLLLHQSISSWKKNKQTSPGFLPTQEMLQKQSSIILWSVPTSHATIGRLCRKPNCWSGHRLRFQKLYHVVALATISMQTNLLQSKVQLENSFALSGKTCKAALICWTRLVVNFPNVLSAPYALGMRHLWSILFPVIKQNQAREYLQNAYILLVLSFLIATFVKSACSVVLATVLWCHSRWLCPSTVLYSEHIKEFKFLWKENQNKERLNTFTWDIWALKTTPTTKLKIIQENNMHCRSQIQKLII